MKTKILTGVLSRSEMKSIMAGDLGGNIHCNYGGNQVECPLSDLLSCTDLCIAESGDDCWGCAEFP
jgi:hypothetical protein